MWCIEEPLAVLGSIPRLDLRGPDNQSPMKQDNRDHWALSSPVTSYICFKSTLRPLHLFQSHSDSNGRSDIDYIWQESAPFSIPPKICLNICRKKSTGCFAGPWVPFRFLRVPVLTPPPQSTQGNVVNFCYDRLRDNPTIAKHFVYLSHSR